MKNWLDTSATIVSSTKVGFVSTAEEDFAKSNNAKHALLQAANSGKFDMIYVGTNKGEMIVSNDWNAPAGYDPRQRPWYQGAVAAMFTTLITFSCPCPVFLAAPATRAMYWA